MHEQVIGLSTAKSTSPESVEGEVLPLIADGLVDLPSSEHETPPTQEATLLGAASVSEVTGRHRSTPNRSRRAAGIALTAVLATGTLASSAPRSGHGAASIARQSTSVSSTDHFTRVPVSQPANTAAALPDVSTPYDTDDWHAEVGHERKPQLFDRRELPNAANIGAIEIVYNPANNAKRDKLWGSIDKYWATQGKTFANGAKHPNPGSSLVHPLVADTYNPNMPMPKSYQGLTPEELDHKILSNGFVLDNQPAKNPNIYVVAGHNVTPVPTWMQIGDKVYNNPRMGINAPLLPGDQAKIYTPDSEQKGVAVVNTFTLYEQFVVPMSEGLAGYNKLYNLKATSNEPLLVMYHCTPEGLATERHVTVYRWEDTSYQNLVLKRIK